MLARTVTYTQEKPSIVLDLIRHIVFDSYICNVHNSFHRTITVHMTEPSDQVKKKASRVVSGIIYTSLYNVENELNELIKLSITNPQMTFDYMDKFIDSDSFIQSVVMGNEPSNKIYRFPIAPTATPMTSSVNAENAAKFMYLTTLGALRMRLIEIENIPLVISHRNYSVGNKTTIEVVNDVLNEYFALLIQNPLIRPHIEEQYFDLKLNNFDYPFKSV